MVLHQLCNNLLRCLHTTEALSVTPCKPCVQNVRCHPIRKHSCKKLQVKTLSESTTLQDLDHHEKLPAFADNASVIQEQKVPLCHY